MLIKDKTIKSENIQDQDGEYGNQEVPKQQNAKKINKNNQLNEIKN